MFKKSLYRCDLRKNGRVEVVHLLRPVEHDCHYLRYKIDRINGKRISLYIFNFYKRNTLKLLHRDINILPRSKNKGKMSFFSSRNVSSLLNLVFNGIQRGVCFISSPETQNEKYIVLFRPSSMLK